MALLIGLLGPLVIEGEDRQFGKVPRKARALLAYMAAQRGRAVSRERLSDLLWPYQGSDQARHSLRNCLLELRKALAPAAGRHLAAEFANCRLQDVDVDIEHFERLSRSSTAPNCSLRPNCIAANSWPTSSSIPSRSRNGWPPSGIARSISSAGPAALDRACRTRQANTMRRFNRRAGSRRSIALSEIGQRALIRAYARAGRRPEALGSTAPAPKS